MESPNLNPGPVRSQVAKRAWAIVERRRAAEPCSGQQCEAKQGAFVKERASGFGSCERQSFGFRAHESLVEFKPIGKRLSASGSKVLESAPVPVRPQTWNGTPKRNPILLR